MSELVGGRYEVIRKIAEGGMGAVFEARHHMTKKIVALKVLFPHIGKDNASKQRFLREVSAPAQIGHPGIVDVSDSGVDPDGSLWVAMEMLRGQTMREWLDASPKSRDQILDFFVRVLDPLAAAHSQGIVHRDLKPENVFLHQNHDGSTVVKILDFGIARDLDTSKDNVTHTGIAMGTPHYMAPEQAMSARGVVASADIWAIGAMMYESLAGRTPFGGETASAIVVHACTQPHEPMQQLIPDLQPAIAHLVDRCLDKDPTKRPANAAELGQLLRAARPGHEVPATMGPLPAMSTPLTRDGSMAQPSAVGMNVPTAQGSIGGAAGFGAPTPQTPGPAGMTAAMGGGPAPQAPQGGFGGAPGYGTPSPGPGYGTPAPAPAGTFGAPTPTPTPGPGFGTPSPGPGYAGTPAPAMAPGYAGTASSGGGGKGMWIALGVVALLVVGGGIAVVVALSGDDAPGTQDGTAIVSVVVPDGGGELLVDGVSRGPIANGAQIELSPGAHTLQLRVAGTIRATQQVTAQVGVPTTANLTSHGIADRLQQQQQQQNPGTPGTTGSTVSGQLMAGDQTLQSGEYTDTYTFNWTQGQSVRVEAISSEFDTYLIVRSPSGQQHDNDDAAGGNTNAGLTVAVTETGSWQVKVTSYQPGETGNYQLVTR